MALYQPSNITPSTFAGIGAGVIDATDNVSISWQVNGTSAMTGYSIAIYANTTASALVHTFTSPAGFSPFYGTDAQGNPVFYVFESGSSWASAGLSNGNSYKIKITQKWKNNPSDTSETEKTVVQTSESVFVTRAKPSVSVSPASGTLTSVSQTFTGSYSQTQGDALSWVRWVLRNSSGDVIDDTGTIYTGVLSYTYDGFFNGENYTLQCTVQTSSGAEVTTTNSYAVSYSSAEQTGGISLTCNPDDSVTVSWAAGIDIPGGPSAVDYGTISDGVLHLAAERSITWNTVNRDPMAFSSPYCFAWRGRIGENGTSTETVSSGAWELVKTYPQKHSTTVSHTTAAASWGRNPNVSDSETRNVNTTITVNTAHTTAGSCISTGSPLSVTTSTGDYAYRTSSITPPTITVTNNISSYSITQVSYVGDDDIRRPLPDAYVETVQNGNKLTFTVYSNETIAYNHNIIVYADVTYVEYYYGTKIESPVSGDTGISNLRITSSPNLSNTRISYSNNTFTIYAEANSPNTYSISYQYTHTVSPSNLYMATWAGTQTTGTLNSASIQSTTAGGGASVTVSGNTYRVTEYSPNNTSSAQTSVTLNYTTQDGIGSDSYRSIVTGSEPGATSVSLLSTTATRATVAMGDNGAYTVTMYYSSPVHREAEIQFTEPHIITIGRLAELTNGTNTIIFSATNSQDPYVSAFFIGSTFSYITVPIGAWDAFLAVRPDVFEAVFFDQTGNIVGTGKTGFVSSLPSPVSSITLNGAQDCDFVYLTQNETVDFAPSGYIPAWDGDTMFYASFTSDLQAGTTSEGGELSAALYRQHGSALEPVGLFGGNVHSVRDYKLKSSEEYIYHMFYVSQGTYSSGAQSSPMCRRFRQHTLIEAEEDSSLPGVYHPVNVWRFRDNLDAGAYTNQNQPVLLDNFTKYPLWQPSSPAAKAGTLTALVGMFVNGVYTGDTAENMNALFALSESLNPLFYRDMKGNLYMVRLSGPITQTVNNRTGPMEVSVSVPWVEAGDADGVKIYTVTEG